MPFNSEQQKAIDASKTTNVVISAGAGSGKTSTLSQKVYKLIAEDKIDTSRILVLTFTNKAAHEMKERIIAKFKENKSADPELEDKILSSHIQTFDSAFLYLVKKYNTVLNLPKNVSISDDTILEEKRNELILKCLENSYQNEPKRMETILSITDYFDDRQLTDIIKGAEINYSLLSFKKKQEFINDYENKFLSDEFFEENYKEYVKGCKEELKILFDALYIAITYPLKREETNLDPSKILLSAVNESNYEENSKDYETASLDEFKSEPAKKSKASKVQVKPKFWLSILAKIINGDDERFFQLCQENFDKISHVKDSKDGEEFKKYTKEIKDKIKNIVALGSFEEQKETVLKTKAVVLYVVEVIKKVEKELFEFKKLNNIFTFSDITNFVLTLITDEKYKDIKDEIIHQFDYLLVDEYQDTNDDQELFLDAFKDTATIFTVGDAKQSIYAFRSANLELFLNRRELYRKINDANHQVIEMQNNYRSVEQMIDDINLIFENYMSKAHGGLIYDDKEKLVYDKKADLYKKARENRAGEYGVTILRPTKKKINAKTNQQVEDEALMIIEDIKNKIDNHYQVFDKNFNLRDCTYKDFAILIRKTGSFNTFKDLLLKHKIPFNIQEKGSLLDKDPIYLIQSLLNFYVALKKKDTKSINLPHTFLSIARSYIRFGSDNEYKNDTEIIRVVKDNKIKESNIYKEMKQFVSETKDEKASTVFLALLKRFKVIEKLPHAGDSSNLMSKIESFYQILLSQESLGQGIEDFAELFHSFNKFKVDVNDNTIYELENAVTIETIHASKGLEYPIVYMPITKNNLGGSNNKLPYSFSKNYGLLIQNRNLYCNRSTYLDDLFKNKEGDIDENINEHVRLFYVALTRAKESLYIVGSEFRPAHEHAKESLFDMLKKTPYQEEINEEYLNKYRKAIDDLIMKVYETARGNYRNAIKTKNEAIRTLPPETQKKKVYVKVADISVLPTIKEEFDKAISLIGIEIASHLYKRLNDDDKCKLYARWKFNNYSIRNKTDFKNSYPNLDENFEVIKNELEGLISAKDPGKFNWNENSVFLLVEMAEILDGILGDFQYANFDNFRQRFAPIPKDIEVQEMTVSEEKIPSFNIDDSEITYKPTKERKRASKAVVSEDATDEVLKLGTKYHKILELIDLKNPDYSFIENTKEKEVIRKVLDLHLFENLDDVTIYKEYEYFDEENQAQGSIDLLLVSPNYIKIVDYKLKETTDPAYIEQLRTYKRNVERLFKRKDITCHLLSLMQQKLIDIDV